MGRPPLNDSAMTPNTIKDHKKNCISQKRKIAKIPSKRRDAARKRWDMRLLPYGEIDEDSDSDLAEEMDASEGDGNVDDEVKKGESERTIKRAKCELVGYLPFDNTKLFLKIYQCSSGATPEMKKQMNGINDVLMLSGKMSKRQIKYQYSNSIKMLKMNFTCTGCMLFFSIQLPSQCLILLG